VKSYFKALLDFLLDPSGKKRTLETLEQAEAGDAEAQYSLGVMYAYGEGVPRDKTEAVKWYRKAADRNRVAAKVSDDLNNILD